MNYKRRFYPLLLPALKGVARYGARPIYLSRFLAQCAVDEIERLSAEVTQLKATNDHLRAELNRITEW